MCVCVCVCVCGHVYVYSHIVKVTKSSGFSLEGKMRGAKATLERTTSVFHSVSDKRVTATSYTHRERREREREKGRKSKSYDSTLCYVGEFVLGNSNAPKR